MKWMVCLIALTFAKEKAGFPESSVCPLPPVCIAHSWCLALSQSSQLALCHWVFGHQLTETARFPSAFPDADRHPGGHQHKTVTHTALPVSLKTRTVTNGWHCVKLCSSFSKTVGMYIFFKIRDTKWMKTIVSFQVFFFHQKWTHHVVLKSFVGLWWGGAGFDRMLQFCVQLTKRWLYLGEKTDQNWILYSVNCPDILSNNSIYLVEATFELLLVRGAFLQLSIKLLHALLQLLPVPADLGQTGLNASCFPWGYELGQRLGICLQLRRNLRPLPKLCTNNLDAKNKKKNSKTEIITYQDWWSDHKRKCLSPHSCH